MNALAIFVIFICALTIAARLLLRGEHRPPIPPDDEEGLGDHRMIPPSARGRRRCDKSKGN